MKLRAEALIQRFSHGLPYVLIACVAHITMDKGGLFFLQDITDCLVHLRRCRHIGVAQTEIIHILRTVDGGQTLTLLKHGADGGIVIDQWFHFL